MHNRALVHAYGKVDIQFHFFYEQHNTAVHTAHIYHIFIYHFSSLLTRLICFTYRIIYVDLLSSTICFVERTKTCVCVMNNNDRYLFIIIIRDNVDASIQSDNNNVNEF